MVTKSLIHTLLLLACFGLYSPTAMAQIDDPFSESIDTYLTLAEQESPLIGAKYQIIASAKLIDQGMLARAKQLLNQISIDNQHDDLEAQQLQQQKQLLLAQLDRYQQKLTAANNKLKKINPHLFDQPYWLLRYYQLYEQVLAAQQDYLQSAIQGINRLTLLSETEINQQLPLIWQRLLQAPIASISKARQSLSHDDPLTAWLSLAIIYQSYAQDNTELVNALHLWQGQYDDHPANQLIPKKIQQKAQTNPAKKIALLVPLNGKLANAGQIIRDGFITAYYEANQQSPQPVSVRIYDSSVNNIAKVYRKALRSGADFIVGPLDKNKVNHISKFRFFQVPTLTLNYVNQANSARSWLYQFGLSPKDEAMQIAQHAAERGFKNAIIMVPDNDWGQAISQQFAARWQSLGGSILQQINYEKDQAFAKTIGDTMQVDQSQQRHKSLQNKLRSKLAFVPRRRQDVDFIFMVANPSKAREIRPLLTYYYSGSIPIYSTSNIYNGYANPINDRDLNGIIFPDIPWILSKPAQLSPVMQKQFNANPRLFALGYDAFRISQQFPELVLQPNFSLHGATGELQLDQQQVIKRQLSWATFNQGKIKQQG